MADSECMAEFRVNKRDLPHLAECLQIPDAFVCNQGSVCEGMEAICMLLRRLSYPCRYSDMIPRFGRPAPVLSMVTNKVIDFIYDTHGWRIKQWNHYLLSPAHLQTYADAVYAKGAALENCFGFVDRTVRPIARPDENQTFHCYEFQKARSMMRACCVILDYFSSYSGMRILQQDNLCAYMGTLHTP